jgi:hypothetical protein
MRSNPVQDEPFQATAKRLIARLRKRREDLISGKWEDETTARVLVAEIRLMDEILVEMQDVSNTNFGESEL